MLKVKCKRSSFADPIAWGRKKSVLNGSFLMDAHIETKMYGVKIIVSPRNKN